MFGVTKEEFEGRPLRTIPSEAPEESLAAIQRVLEGESFIGAEIKQQHKDGRLLDISYSAAPLHDRTGRVRGFITVGEDITLRKEAEETLRTQAQVLESMAEGVTVTNRHGHIVYTN